MLDDIKNHGIEPSYSIFAPFVHYFAKQGDMETAFDVFEDMKENSIEPDLPLYNSLINYDKLALNLLNYYMVLWLRLNLGARPNFGAGLKYF